MKKFHDSIHSIHCPPLLRIRWSIAGSTRPRFLAMASALGLSLLAIGCGGEPAAKLPPSRQIQTPASPEIPAGKPPEVNAPEQPETAVPSTSSTPSESPAKLKPLVIKLPDGFVFEEEIVPSEPKPIPEEIARAWIEAGAEIDWWGVDETDGTMMSGDPQTYGLSQVIASIKLSQFDEETIGKLPEPGVPFALILSKVPVTVSAIKSLGRFKTLEAIDLGRAERSSEELSALAEISSLHSLDLENATITDAEFTAIAGLGQVRRLSLYGIDDITGERLGELAEMDRLESLDLSSSDITGENLPQIGQLTRLKALYLNEVPPGKFGEGLGFRQFKPEMLKAISQLQELRILNLFGRHIGDDGAEVLTSMLYLRNLTISLNGLTDEGVRSIAALPSLRELDLGANELTDDGLFYLSRAARLKRLDLWSCEKISSDGLVHLKNLPQLQNLVLRDCELAEAGEFAASLRKLDLSSNPLTDSAFDEITKLVHLEKLSLEGTKVTDEGAARLGSLTSLQELKLSKTEITGACFAALADLPHLAHLTITETKVTDENLSQLERTSSLRSIEIFRTPVSAEAADRLANKLPDCEVRHWNPR